MRFNKRTKKLLLDIAERSGHTFWQTFAAIWVVSGLDIGWKTLQAAALAGALAVVKGSIASQTGSPNTAATLPSGPDTDQG